MKNLSVRNVLVTLVFALVFIVVPQINVADLSHGSLSIQTAEAAIGCGGCGGGSGGWGWDPWYVPEPADPIDRWGGGGGGGHRPTVAPSCVAFTASPSVVTAGSPTTIAWLVAGNPSSISISPTIGTVTTFNGSAVVHPLTTTTYTLTVSNTAGSANCQVTVTVPPLPTPSCTLSANPTSITAGSSSTLSWRTVNASSATLSGVGTLSLWTTPIANGTSVVTPSSTTTYTLTVVGAGGQTANCTSTVVVTTPPPAPTCDSFTANPSSITTGGSSTLSWNTTNASSVSINQGIGSVAADGSRSVSPTSSKTYTLTATGAGGTATCTTRVTVTPPGDLACAITVNPDTINRGDSSSLTWSSTNATNCVPTNFSTNGLFNGSTTVSPIDTTTYSMTCTRPGTGSTTGSWTKEYDDVTDLWCPRTLPRGTPPPQASYVYDGVPDCPSNVGTASCSTIGGECKVNTWNPNTCTVRTALYRCDAPSGGGSTYVPPTSVTCSAKVTVIPPAEAPTCDFFDATPNSIVSGDSSTLSWGTTNATSVSINRGVGSVSVDGTTNVSPTSNTTYTLTATGPGGTATCTRRVTVVPPTVAPICDLFTSNPTSIIEGGTATLSWDTTNATSVSINRGVGTVGVDGLTNVSPSATTLYTLTATGPGGTTTCTTRVIVTPPPAPTCDFFRANPTSITSGGSSTLSWGTTNATSVSINQGVGTVAVDGSHVVSPTGTKTYTLTATGPGGTATCTRKVTVVPPNSPLCTLTTDGLGIGETTTRIYWTLTNVISATLNGTTIPVTNDSKVVKAGAYEIIATGAGGDTVSCGLIIEPPIETPRCTLTADKTALDSGETTTIRWTIENATGAVLTYLGTDLNITPSNGTQVTGGLGVHTLVVRNSIGQTDTCSVELTQTTGPAPSCTLSLDRDIINTGESAVISWTSTNATSGFINNNVGTTTPVASGSFTIFPPDSRLFTGDFSGPLGTTTCSVAITVRTGGGGCTGNCGGGLNQPNVVLFQKPGDQLLAFVSLSQIPYTGFEAGPILTFFFWLAVGLWSIGLTYVFFGKGGMQFVARRVFAMNGSSYDAYEYSNDSGAVAEQEYKEYEAVETAEPSINLSTAYAPAVPATYTMQMPAPAATPTAPQPKSPANDGVPELSDVIESRAHAAGVLLSPEAVTIASKLSSDRAETLIRFGNILNEAVRTIPREDGWILLSSDRMNEMVHTLPLVDTASVVSAMSLNDVAPRPATVEALSDSTPGALVRALFSGDRDTAFALVREYEKDGIKPTKLMTGTATALDGLFCSRKNGVVADDLSLADLAQNVSDETLAQLVEIFTHALDARYASPYTGVKLAVAQAFDEVN